MKAYAPELGFYHNVLPQEQRFDTFFVPRGWGTCLFRKNSPGFGLGGVGLELWN